MTNPLSRDDPKFQQQFELYRLRAEEYERSFYSLRGVEWQVAFQIYAGYAGVAAGFFSLRGFERITLAETTLATVSLLLLVLLFGVGLFCQFQIQRRLHFTRTMQNAYLKSIHQVLAPELSIPAGTIVPGFQRWWAFRPLQIVNVAITIAIATSIIAATKWCACHGAA